MGGFLLVKFCKNNNEKLVLPLFLEIDLSFKILRNIQIHTFYRQHFLFHFGLLNSNTLTNLCHKPRAITRN